MSDKTSDALFQLIWSLPEEAFFQARKVMEQKSNPEPKVLELLDLIRKSPGSNAKSLSQLLYDDPASKAFIMLKARLLSRLADTFLLSDYLGLLESESKIFNDVTELRKKLILAGLFRKKGWHELANEFYETVRKRGRELDRPELVLSASLELRSYFGVLGHPEVFKLEEEIRQLFLKYELDADAAGLQPEIYAISRNRPSAIQEVVEIMQKRIEEFEQRFSVIDSPRARITFLSYRLTNAGKNDQFEELNKLFTEFERLIKEHPGIAEPQRTGLIYTRYAENLLRLYHFKEALTYCSKSLEFHSPSRINYHLTKTLSGLCEIYLNNPVSAVMHFKEVLDFSGLSRYPDCEETSRYRMASAHFLLKEFRQATKDLGHLEVLLKDKEGWNLGVRILEILILIETEEYYTIKSKLDAFRKHFAKYPDYLGNWEYQYRILNKLDLCNYDFKVFAGKNKKLIDELIENYTWRPLSSEVIPFVSWLISKLEKKELSEVLQNQFEKVIKK